MLVDGVTFTATGSADSFKVRSGATFPASPLDGQMFKLTAASDQSQPGLYYWDTISSSWVAIDSKAIKGVDAGIATLNAQGKILESQIPSIAITDTFVVSSEAAMLALSAETGDVAIRTDLSNSFILRGSSPSTLGNWSELLSPQDEGAGTYDIASSIVGKPDAATEVLVFYTPRAFAFGVNMSGSIMKAAVAATASTAFAIKKNDVTFCTVTFAAAGTVATFGTSAATTFNVGDKLSIASPAQDATLANVHFSLAGMQV